VILLNEAYRALKTSLSL